MNTDSLSPELRGRLDRIQRELLARGVTDLKLVRSPGSHSPVAVAQDMAAGLEAYLQGRCHPLPPLGDCVRGCEEEAPAGEDPLLSAILTHRVSLESASENEAAQAPLDREGLRRFA